MRNNNIGALGQHLNECPPVVSVASVEIPERWFVMRATYSREMKARDMLSEKGVECYVPTKRERTFRGEEAIDKEVSLVRNYIFVKTTRAFMDDCKRRMESTCPLRYVMDKNTGAPMVVREKEMEDFMRVTREAGDSIRFLDDPQELLRKGADVEVIAGPFAGVRGKVVRFHRDRRVVVSIADIMAVAMSSMPISWLKIST